MLNAKGSAQALRTTEPEKEVAHADCGSQRDGRVQALGREDSSE